MLKKITMILCVAVSLFALPTKAQTDESLYNHFIFEAFYTPKDYIVHFADKYQAPKEQLLAVSWCESMYNPEAIGDHGSAKNIFQYHKGTFDRYSALMGEQLDYNSAHDQAKLTAWVFKNMPKEKRAWTCSKIVGII